MKTLDIRKINESNLTTSPYNFKNEKESINTKSFECKNHTARDHSSKSKFYSEKKK